MKMEPIKAPGLKKPAWGPWSTPFPRPGVVVAMANPIWGAMWLIVQGVKDAGFGYDEY